jgi:hypothetical protein
MNTRALTAVKDLGCVLPNQYGGVDELELFLGRESDLLGIAHVIQDLKSAHRIILRIQSQQDASSTSWMTQFHPGAVALMESIGRLLGVEEIRFEGPLHKGFPVTLLTHLFQAKFYSCLKTLTIRVHLIGSKLEFGEFIASLKHQHLLEQMLWEQEWIIPGGITTTSNNSCADFNMLVGALSSLPKLKTDLFYFFSQLFFALIWDT